MFHKRFSLTIRDLLCKCTIGFTYQTCHKVDQEELQKYNDDQTTIDTQRDQCNRQTYLQCPDIINQFGITVIFSNYPRLLQPACFGHSNVLFRPTREYTAKTRKQGAYKNTGNKQDLCQACVIINLRCNVFLITV